MNYRLSLTYNGTNYHGWSIQPNNITIQEVVTNAVKAIVGNVSIAINASGRTDAGVHALDQVINIKSKHINLPAKDLQRAIQSKLPRDIHINSCIDVNDQFHARYSAKSKSYIYIINTKPNFDAINHTNIYQYNKPINHECINIIKTKLIGTHNFLSFSTSELEDTIRTITDITYTEEGGLLKIKVTGDGFLRSMVRMIIGAIISLNENKINVDDINEWLEHPAKGKSQYKAPACGLYLAKVYY